MSRCNSIRLYYCSTWAIFLKNDKSESFLDFLSSLQICLFEDYAMKTVEVTIGHFRPNLGQNSGFSHFWSTFAQNFRNIFCSIDPPDLTEAPDMFWFWFRNHLKIVENMRGKIRLFRKYMY